jgi:N-acetylmuramoyl-L-alanine amidase
MESGIPLTSDLPYAIVSASYLNIRSGPGVNYAVLGQASGGEVLPIVGRSADSRWYQVTSRFGTGWISTSYVIARNEFGGSPVTSGSAAGAPMAGPIGIINTGALNLRSGPGIQYTDIGTLAGGTETRIIGRTNDWSWWLLETPTMTGWANAIYVLVRGDTSGVPYVAPGGTTSNDGVTAPPPAAAGPVAFIIGGALNVRSGPNSAFPSLGSVTAGTRLPIIGQSPDRGWWYVQSSFGNGYVSKLYVIAEGNTSGVPVIQ